MLWRVISALLFIVGAPVVGCLLDGADRVITARMQGRQGPPLLQPFYDVMKLLRKDPVVVNNVQNFFLVGFIVFLVFTGALFFFGGDILLVFFALTLAEIYFIMASCSSNSPFSSMGAQRELIQMVAYEPMVLLVAIGFYMTNHTFAVREILAGEQPAILYMPGIFLGFLFILTIKFRKSPFDISTSHHAHQEMVKGTTTEFSGRVLALTEIAHWYETVFLLGVVALFFLWGAWWSWLIAIAVCLLSYFLEILIDNTYARVRWQAMLQSSWLVALVLGVLNVLILSYIR